MYVMGLSLSNITKDVKDSFKNIDTAFEQYDQLVEDTYQPKVDFDALLQTYLLKIYPIGSVYIYIG